MSPHSADDRASRRPEGRMLSLAEAGDLDVHSAGRMYRMHVNRELFTIYRMLGLAHLDVESAEGVEIRLRGGRRILDFTSALGVLNLGHNHPRIIAAERWCHDRLAIDALKLAPSRLQAVLAHNLAVALPAPLEVSFLTTSGAEAVEAAMKLVQRVQGPARRMFLTTTGAFHGKTAGALALTRSEDFGAGFLLGLPPEYVLEVPYGDVAALAQIIASRTGEGRESDVAAMIVEPIQGQGVRTGPDGYLREVIAICRRAGILSIVDEVKVGLGRTGHLCAFMAEEAVPDILTISKSLGGGKRAIGAMVTSRTLSDAAYGRLKDAATHTTTFGGLGETCAVAIEALNLLADPQLLASVRSKGEYLRQRLEALQLRYPRAIHRIRGRGLFLGVEFDFLGWLGVPAKVPQIPFVYRKAETMFIACLIRELHERHGILAHFSTSDPEVLHVMPPLVVETRQLDRFCEALEDVVRRGLPAAVARFVGGNLVAAR